MKRLILSLAVVLMAATAVAQQRSEQLLERGWRFTREDSAEFSSVGYDDSAWQEVVVPHDWAIYGPFSINNDKQNVAITQDGQKEAMEHAGRTGGLPFVGVGWYRLNFEVPEFTEGKRAAILFDGVTFTIPKRGEKSDLLEFSLRSARIYRAEIHKNMEIKNPERHTERLMEAMRKELHLAKQPRHIECFDNSNLQGTNPVASCVVFRDGKPSKREYRHFNVKSVEGPDDFASMREIVHRRYSRLLDEGAELPDLIIVDGGKGQLSSAYAILKELGIENRVPIVGLAKRLEEVYYPDDPTPYYLSRMGEPLKVICHIRDEAHRFGITFHRQKRDKSFIDSELSHIPGIGDKSLTTLLRHFKTVRAVREASREQLTEVVGTKRAEAIINYFGGGDEQK